MKVVVDAKPNGAPQPTLTDLFEEFAARAPDAIAVKSDRETLSYPALNRRANVIANALLELGVGPETPVAVSVERSAELVAALLGVLKAGCAYVPLEPSLPQQRLAHMLADSGAKVAVCDDAGRAALQVVGANVRRVGVHEEGDDSEPVAVADPENLAYILYTSGTTGRPKGVQIPRRALANHAVTFARDMRCVGPQTRSVLVKASYAFDMFNLELFPALFSGQSAVIAEPGSEFNGGRLFDLLERHAVTDFFLTPTHARLLLDSGARSLDSIACVYFGGEALDSELCRRAHELWRRPIYNLYGPTEMCVLQTWARFEEVAGLEGIAPIGQQCGNFTVELLGPDAERSPDGTDGEIVIAGPGEARGYKNLARRTALAFVPCPFATTSGARMYRTGDVGVRAASGDIHYRGRIDDQLQIGGVRVELAEVEAVLQQAPGVAQGAVRAENERAGAASGLIAYIVPSPGQHPTADTIRGFLADHVAVVPGRVMFLDALPTNSSGKVDRGALPDPVIEVDRTVTAPRDAREESVAAAWRAHLKIETLDVTDNFFELGGHSLNAVLVLHELSTRFNLELDLPVMFDSPTIAGLSERIAIETARAEQQLASGTEPVATRAPIPRHDPTREAPLSSAQQQMWFLHQLADQRGYYVPLALRLDGELDADALRESFEHLAMRHAVLRTIFPMRGDGPVQRVLDGIQPAQWTREDLRGSDDAAALILASGNQQRFDLEADPPFRVTLFQLEDDAHVLLMLFHHIAIDEWGVQVVLRELDALYTRRTGRGVPPLGAVPAQAADYAVWEAERLQQPAFETATEFWRDSLNGLPGGVEWPWNEEVDDSGEALPVQVFEFEVPTETVARVLELARINLVSPAVCYLGVLAAVIARITGQTDMVFGLPVTVRDRPDLQGVLGMMVNTLPLGLRLPDDGQDFHALLSRLREVWMGAMTHKWVPLDRIVHAVGAERRGAKIPLFDMMFNYLPLQAEHSTLGDLKTVDVSPQMSASMYPLVVTAFAGSDSHRLEFALQRDRFSDAEAAIVVNGFRELLAHATAEPTRPVKSFELFDPSESELLQHAKSRVTSARLRAALRDLLPAGALPSQIVFLDEMPRLPSGKIDRAALAKLTIQQEPTAGGVLPRTPTERLVAELWQQHLKRPTLGVHENFFEAGGHSLVAVRVQHDLARALGRDVPLNRLFGSPTVAALAKWIDDSAGDEHQLSVTKRDYDDEVPASSEQRRMWFLQSLEPASAAYNVPFGVRLSGNLDEDGIRACLQTLVRRHEVLRTVYTERDGQPVQKILPASTTLRCERIDIEGGDKHEAARAAARAVIAKPFALERELPIRASLLKLGTEEHVLLLVFHHIAVDEWSVGLLVAELCALYREWSSRNELALSEPELQYADYALWQQDQESGGSDEGLRFWREHLESATAHIDWPIGEEPGGGSQPAETVTFRWDTALSSRVRAWARDHRATEFVTLYALFAAFLSRLTGQRDLTIGVPVTGRTQAGLQNVVGLLLNTVPLRARFGPATNFEEFFRDAQQTWLASQPHHAVPLDEIVRATATERAAGSGPLFDTMFTFVQGNAPVPSFEGLQASPFETDGTPQAKAALVLLLAQNSDRFDGVIEFDASRFTRRNVATLIEQFGAFVERCIASPHAPLANHGSVASNGDVLDRWGRGEAVAVSGQPFHEWFARQAKATPDRVALLFADERVTYEELNRRANQLAHRLLDAGVTPDALVGVSAEPHPNLVIALIAVLKAGGCYVPLEPSLPPSRLEYMLADSGARVVVCDEAGRAALGAVDATMIDVEESRLEARHTNPEVPVDLEHLAYLLYTSGTTGRPKGVMIPHRGLTEVSQAWAKAYYDFHEGDRTFLLKASYTFDMFIAELFPVLAGGGSVAIAEPGAHRNPERIEQLVRRHGVTDIYATPTNIQMLLESGIDFAGSGLRRIYSGGEALAPRTCHDVRMRWGVEIWNVYGPTEMCVGQTVGRVELAGGTADQITPIGRPTPNHRVMIVDEFAEPVETGQNGEISISGPGEARGYLGMARRTAQSFLPQSASGAAGARMYSTGDVARWRDDGQVEYRGRRDDQLKIRGVRVELGEIEARLVSAPGVAQAAVRAVTAGSGAEVVLHAYVVAQDLEAAPTPSELQAHLAQFLSEAVIPSQFVFLPTMPLLASGKIDRKALTNEQSTASQAATIQPRNDTERAIAKVWQNHLQLPSIGVHQNFFSIGGHSLVAIRVRKDLADHFGRDIALARIFEHPTIAEMADWLTNGADDHDTAPIVPHPNLSEAPASSDQRRMWFLQQLDPSSSAYHVPLVTRIRGPLDVEALRSSADALLARHAILRTVYFERAGEPWQTILPPATQVPWSFEDLSAESAPMEHARTVLARDIETPFDLEIDPSIRLTLCQLGEDDYVMLLLFHHIAIDEWSTGILIDELSRLYAHAIAGDETSLAPLPAQYADYAIWQRERLASEAFGTGINFWREHLAGAADHIDWHIGEESPNAVHLADRVDFEWRPGVAQQLRAFASAQGASDFGALFAAFAAFLARATGQSDLTLGLPTTVRQQSELQGMVGFLLNTLPVRAQPVLSGGFSQWFDESQRDWRQVMPHQWIPLDEIVRAIAANRGRSGTPLFDTIFTFLPAASEGENLFEGLETSSLDVQAATGAKAPLSVSMTESGGVLRGTFEYDTARFDRRSIESLVSQFEHFVAACLADPDRSMVAHPMLEAAHSGSLLDAARGATTEVPDIAAHELFEKVAARAPQQIALTFRDTSMSYAELDRRANAFAGYLTNLGVCSGASVGLCLPRSFDLVAAMLGTLKAGCAYVPMDVGLPGPRLELMARVADVSLVIVEEGSQARFPDDVRTAPADAAMFHGTGAAPKTIVHGEQPAYVLFTSGSTGQPKGVVIPHRALVNQLQWLVEEFGFDDDDVFLQKTPISFDASVWEFFAPLALGARLCLGHGEAHRDVDQIIETIAAQSVSVLQLVPTQLAMLLTQEGFTGEHLPSLRQIFCGGEALEPALVREAQRRFDAELVNLYGPTEVCINSTSYRCPPLAADEQVSLGGPVANTRTYVFEGQGLQLREDDATGELFIAGEQLATGYANAPALTATRFLPDPCAASPGTRMYRTGDAVRRSNGQLEYKGRVDLQVKIRGHRIELEEIEAVLNNHGDVAQAAVLLWNANSGAETLVAYVVGRDAIDAESLRSHCAAALPDYMVPAAFVTLDELPVTSSGKLDRKALPEPGAHVANQEQVSPRTPLEEAIAAIWREHLNLESFGVHQNFFELGGYSLLALQVRQAMAATLEVTVPLDLFFEEGTVAHFAAVLSGEATSGRSATAIHMKRSDGPSPDCPLVVVHPVNGLLFSYRALVAALPDDLEVIGVQSPKVTGGEVPETIEELAAIYAREVASVLPGKRCYLAGWSFGGVVAHAMISEMETLGINVDHLFLLDSFAPGAEIPAGDEPNAFETFATDLGATLGASLADFANHREALQSAPHDARFATLSAMIETWSRGEIKIQADLLGDLFEMYRTHLDAFRSYRPDPVDTPTTLFAATREVPAGNRGWSAILPPDFRTLELDCDHYGIMRSPAVSSIAVSIGSRETSKGAAVTR